MCFHCSGYSITPYLFTYNYVHLICTHPSSLVICRLFPKAAHLGSNLAERERERERERENFAFAPWCRVQDVLGFLLGSVGGTSSIRGGACHPVPERRAKRSSLPAHRRGKKGNGTYIGVRSQVSEQMKTQEGKKNWWRVGLGCEDNPMINFETGNIYVRASARVNWCPIGEDWNTWPLAGGGQGIVSVPSPLWWGAYRPSRGPSTRHSEIEKLALQVRVKRKESKKFKSLS